jgi:translation initiation factor IF-2
MRVYEISKELGISNKEVLSLLKEKGITLPSHMSQLSDDALNIIKKAFEKNKAPQEAVHIKQEKTLEKNIAPKIDLGGKIANHEITEKTTHQQVEQAKPFVEKPEELDEIQEKVSIRQSMLKDTDIQELEEEPQVQEKVSKILISKGFISKPPVKKSFKRFRRRPKQHTVREEITIQPVTEITLSSSKNLAVFEVAALLGKSLGEIILALLKKGMACNRNNIVPIDLIRQLAEGFGIKFNIKKDEDQAVKAVEKKLETTSAQAVTRWPIAVVMGHVDHGKTTLLDHIRKMNVAGSEKGGITQHLGAYEVDSTHGKIIFLDTPGHEAFSFIRERGSKITDIAILIVAADDGIKPQTVEALNHAKAAGVPIIVAINKIDKVQSTAAIETIKRQLVKYELMPEDWGGQTIVVPISAKTGQGVNELLEMIILQSQLMDLKADPNIPAKAFILESRLEKGFGPVATVICTQGTLKQGDCFLCGNSAGKVRLLKNSFGQKITQAGPSVPVQVVGFDNFAAIGDWLTVVPVAQYLQAKSKQSSLSQAMQPMEASILQPMQKSGSAPKSIKKDINLIIKTDTRGSKEAIMDSIDKLIKANKDIKCPINIVLSAIGEISESDIELAENTSALIMTLHSKVERNATLMAKDKQVEIHSFTIIYQMIEHLQELLNSKREIPTIWKKVGEATVKKVFNIKGVGVIAGCYLRDGIMTRQSKVECVRSGRIVGQGKISSLQRDKKSVKEIHAGYECGFVCDSFQDWAEGDTVYCYNEEKVVA